MKPVLKIILNLLARIIVLPAVIIYWFSVLICGADRVFFGWSQLFSLIPGLLGAFLRRAFYKYILSDLGDDVWISFGSVFSHPAVTIGNRAYVGIGCIIGDVEIQDDVLIGSHVSIINGNQQHKIERIDIPVREQGGEFPRVHIGKDSWLGDRSLVMFDIGRHCVVGAGSVVTKPVEDYHIVVGNPAKQIARRDQLKANVQSTESVDEEQKA